MQWLWRGGSLVSAGQVRRGEGSGRLHALQQWILVWSNLIVSDKCAAGQVSSLQAGQSPCPAASLGVQGGWAGRAVLLHLLVLGSAGSSRDRTFCFSANE